MKYFFLILLFCQSAIAFTENIRHGYFNCLSCHVSPSGGGILTEYGRSLSKELMSTWGTPGEESFLSLAMKNRPEWLNLGGHVRGLQIVKDNPSSQSSKFIPMQADIEIAFDNGEKWVFDATFGMRATTADLSQLNQPFSRRHYVLYRINEENSLRLGQFQFAFGLGDPNHTNSIRRGLGWDQGTESNNLEWALQSDTFSSFLSIVSDSPKLQGVEREKGVALQLGYFVTGNSKIGLSAYQGKKSFLTRQVVGPFAVVSLTEQLYLLSEIDMQSQITTGTSEQTVNGIASFQKLGIELYRGVFPYLSWNRSQLDFSQKNSILDIYSIGLQFLPRPHLEIISNISQERAANQAAATSAYLMLHYYL
jgi:hypothetical protein